MMENMSRCRREFYNACAQLDRILGKGVCDEQELENMREKVEYFRYEYVGALERIMPVEIDEVVFADTSRVLVWNHSTNFDLFIASLVGATNVVKQLVKASEIDVDWRNPDHRLRSPLIVSSMQGHTETVRTLLQAKAFVDLMDEHDVTALIDACWKGRTSVVSTLLAAGANMEYCGYGGVTPLMMACSGGFVDIVDLLIKAGVALDARDVRGHQALSLACYYKKHEVVKRLLMAKASPNADVSQYLWAWRDADMSRAQILEELNNLRGEEHPVSPM